jgi:hypothetical protein
MNPNSHLAFLLYLGGILMEGEDDGGGGGGADKGDKGSKGGKTFTQEELDAIVAREKKSVAKRYEGVDDRLKRLDELEAHEKERANKDLEDRKQYDAALKSKDEHWTGVVNQERQRTEKVLGKYKEVAVNREIENAAYKLKANNPAQVSKLLNDRVRVNEDLEVTVLGEDGEPAFINGKPMTPEQLVLAFRNDPQNKHHFAATQHKPADADKGGDAGDDGGDDKDGGTPEIRKAEKALKEARELAARTHSIQHMSNVLTLERQLNDLKASQAAKK